MNVNMTKTLVGITVLATVLLAGANSSAQTALATGTLRHTNNAAWGTWEQFASDNPEIGFWFRFRWDGNNVATVVPYKFTDDGRVECWWISYYLVGATDPNRTQGWQWVETASGRFVVNKKNPGEDFGTGEMITLSTGTQNYQRIPVSNPQWFGVRITAP